jgi:hypothetical protein
MKIHQQTNRCSRWNASNLDLERVFFKFSPEAEEQFKYYIQNLGDLKNYNRNFIIIKSDFPKFESELEMCRQEIDHGQRFVILESIEGLAFDEIQMSCWIISNLLGTPLAQDQDGKRLIHIYDRDKTKRIKDGARYHQTHESGAIHTDNVNVLESWDYLLVGCVFPAMIGGENIIVSALSVHDFLEKKAPDELAVLRENFWWEYRGISKKLYQAPIITYNKAGEPLFRYLRTYLESAHKKAKKSLSDKQIQALDALDATLNMSEFQIKHRLKAGQILVANDKQILHDRECFVDYPDSISVEEKHAGGNGILCRSLERTWVKKQEKH